MTQLPEHNPGSDLLTAGEVGRLLGGISDETVNRWARTGKLDCITLPSGSRRFRRELIDEILAGGTSASFHDPMPVPPRPRPSPGAGQ